MTRPTPNEDAVRDALKDANGAPAAGDEPAAAAAPVADPEQAEQAPAPAEQQEDELTVAQRERAEYLDLAKRTQADFENYRKRAARDAAAAGGRARTGLIREILPVLDNLERALGVAPEGADDPFVQGVRLVHRDLEGMLARAGVEPIEAEGAAFDPNVHEALSTRPQEGAQPGTVLDVVEKGYRTGDQVVRPARVVVAS